MTAGLCDARSPTTPARKVPEPHSPCGGGRRGRPQHAVLGCWLPVLPRCSLREGRWPRRGQGARWPAEPPRRPRVLRTYPASAPPGASPGGTRSIGDRGRRGSLHRLGPARPASEGTAASTGGAPGQADPHWSGSPPGSASSRKEGGSGGGGGKQSGREQEEEEGGREGRRPLSCTYQSPRRSNVPAVHPGGGCTSPQRSRCSISLTNAVERCSRLSRPLAPGTLPSPCSFYRGLQLGLGQGKSGWHSLGTKAEGRLKTTGWKFWTSARATSPPSWTPSGTAASPN